MKVPKPVMALVAYALFAVVNFNLSKAALSPSTNLQPTFQTNLVDSFKDEIKDNVWTHISKAMECPEACLKMAYGNGSLAVTDLGNGAYQISVLADQFIGSKFFKGGDLIIVLVDVI